MQLPKLCCWRLNFPLRLLVKSRSFVHFSRLTKPCWIFFGFLGGKDTCCFSGTAWWRSKTGTQSFHSSLPLRNNIRVLNTAFCILELPSIVVYELRFICFNPKKLLFCILQLEQIDVYVWLPCIQGWQRCGLEAACAATWYNHRTTKYAAYLNWEKSEKWRLHRASQPFCNSF